MNRNAQRIFSRIGAMGMLLSAALLAGCPWDSSRSSTPAAPTLSGLSDVTVAAGASGAVTFSITGSGTLSVTASSSNQTLLSDSGITGQGVCTAAGSCTLTLTPAADTSGSATVTVAVTDSQGRSATANFVFTVNPPPQISKTVGATGGEVGFDDGRFKLTIPPGALGNDTDIVITELSGNDIPPELRDSSVQHVYRMEPDGLQFIIPATVEGFVPGSFPPPDGAPIIGFASDSGGTLELLSPLTDTVGADGLTASAPLSHFSSVAQLTDDGVTVSFSVSPTQVPVGSAFTLTMAVKQTADSAADGTLTSFLAFNPTIVEMAGSQFDPPGLTLEPSQAQNIVRTLGGTCKIVGTGIFAVSLSGLSLSGVFASAVGNNLTFVLGYDPNTISVECTEGPPPPPPPPQTIIPLGIHQAPGGLTQLEAINLFVNTPIGNIVAPILAIIAGAEGYVIFDPATGDIERAKNAGQLFGSVPVTDDAGHGALYSFGPGQFFGSGLEQFDSNGFVEFTQLLSAATDGFPAGGKPAGGEITLVQNDGVYFIAKQPGEEFFDLSDEFIPAAELGGDPVSAFEWHAGGPVLAVTRQQGRVFYAARGGATPVEVGATGADARRIRCNASGICAVTSYADNTLSLLLWDGENMPVLLGDPPVGSGPVDLDLFELDNGNTLIATTGFNDNTYWLTEVAPDGGVVSNTGHPVDEGCLNPGHIAFVTDDEGLKVVVSCFTSGNYDVVLIEGS